MRCSWAISVFTCTSWYELLGLALRPLPACWFFLWEGHSIAGGDDGEHATRWCWSSSPRPQCRPDLRRGPLRLAQEEAQMSDDSDRTIVRAAIYPGIGIT